MGTGGFFLGRVITNEAVEFLAGKSYVAQCAAWVQKTTLY
jgi:hypothetical protein